MSLLKPRAAPARALGRVVTQPPPRAHNTLSSCRVLVQFVDAGHDDDRVDLCEWRVRVRVKVRVRARVRVRVRVRVSKGIDQIFGVVAADGCVDEVAELAAIQTISTCPEVLRSLVDLIPKLYEGAENSQ